MHLPPVGQRLYAFGVAGILALARWRFSRELYLAVACVFCAHDGVMHYLVGG